MKSLGSCHLSSGGQTCSYNHVFNLCDVLLSLCYYALQLQPYIHEIFIYFCLKYTWNWQLITSDSSISSPLFFYQMYLYLLLAGFEWGDESLPYNNLLQLHPPVSSLRCLSYLWPVLLQINRGDEWACFFVYVGGSTHRLKEIWNIKLRCIWVAGMQASGVWFCFTEDKF